MLDRIRKIYGGRENRASFFNIVSRYFAKGSADYILIERAYSTAKDAFRQESRDDGERYFEHLRAVALILMVYMRVMDANVIAAGLLHDIVEDIEHWSQERLATEFNHDIGELVWWVSKPSLDKFLGNKAARNRAYHKNLRRAPRRAILIKLADRLHNLLTLWNCEEEKQRRKVDETQHFYVPIAEDEFVLIHELEAAINELEASWVKLTE
ncbi:MAG: HD domain-containing protein [Patescibacteria group bacterium]